MDVCKWCELPVKYPLCNLRSEQGWPSYVWKRFGLPNGGRVIGREKTEGRNSYRGGWYKFYGKSSVCQMGPQAGLAVLQLHPALDLLHH